MNAVPMIQRCLELQNEEIHLPWLPNPPIERLPQEIYGPTYTEWCDRCGCSHGVPFIAP